MFGRQPLLGFCGSISAALALTSCGQGDVPARPDGSSDPAIGIALQSRLMAGSDLASNNEANAALVAGDLQPIPLADTSDRSARRAREMARLELLEDGSIASLPAISPNKSTDLNFNGRALSELAQSLGAPTDCIIDLNYGFEWAAELDATARLMPHAQVHAAAGADSASCTLRAISYRTPSGASEAVQYHFNRADRAGLATELHAADPLALHAWANGKVLWVLERKKTGDMAAIDVIYWVDPEG